MKALRIAGNTFIVLGLTMAFFLVYEVVGTSAITHHHQDVLARTFDEPTVAPTKGAPPAPPPKLGAPVARLRIPVIALDRIVVEGTGIEQLKFGPGHYVGTAFPGAHAAVGIAGHRTTWGAPFYNISKLVRGDLLTLETHSGTFTYRVTSHRIVDPADAWVLKGDPASKAVGKLTLTTCHPRYSAAHRLVVWADLVV